MAEHSKLPWRYDEDEDGKDIVAFDGRMVADINPSRGHGVANAALIVRAVNSHDALVAAMEEAISRLETVQDDVGYQFDGDFTSPQDKLLPRLRAALAAALPTGEAG